MGTYTDTDTLPLDRTNWQTTFFDGFNDTQIDRSKWPIILGHPHNNGQFAYSGENGADLKEGNGELTISATRHANGGWTAGGLMTMPYTGAPAGIGFGQTYGRFEFRAAVDKGQGVSPALTLWPSSNSWPPEINVMESPYGNRSQAFFTNHWYQPNGGDNEEGSTQSFGIDTSQWHTYTVDWAHNRLTYYVDGVKLYETTEHVPTEPLSIGMNMFVGGPWDWGGAPDGTTPQQVNLHIDWVRASAYTGPVTITSTAAAEKLIGGAGNDTVSYAASQRGVTIDMVSGVTWDGAVNDTISGFENAVGSALADTIWGDGGNNVLDGGTGGADTLAGGAGTDAVSYGSSQRGVTIDMVSGVTWDGAVNDAISGFENAVGSAFNDTIWGDGGANVVDGGPGGADSMAGGAGTDAVSYGTSQRGVTINMTSGLTWDGAVNDTISGFENAVGSALNDTIWGDGGANVVDGGPGGADSMAGGAGVDTVSYGSSQRGVTVDMVSGVTWDGAVNDTISGFENAVGSALADTIWGDGGNNVLDGGAGADTLAGGAGADRFRFLALRDSATAAPDVITDFSRAGADRIDLSSIDPNAALAGDQAFAFVGTAAFAGGGAAQVRYRQSGADTFVEADAGDGVADLVVRVQGSVAFTASDFVL